MTHMKDNVNNPSGATFRRTVLAYYRRFGRHDLPWRKTKNPYRILVSEIMLQQTQVPRVIDKYTQFLRAFPTFRALADASSADILKVWQGLGYNRRALMLQRCARAVAETHGGILPKDYEALRKLPGVGPYTAGAVLAFAYDLPRPVIETNIRRVYIHHFFPKRRKVADAEILSLVTEHLESVRSPREWYSALMDYGTHLAETVTNPNRRSRHHTRQASFEGSLRQLRGKILRHLTIHGTAEHATLMVLMEDARTPHAVAALEREGFIRVIEAIVHLAV
jgi:A/G-specific adenine glycosylase